MTTLNLDLAVRVKPLNKPTEQVILQIGKHTAHVAAVDIARAMLGPILNRNGQAIPGPHASAPKIGEVWAGQGGIYASVGRNEEGKEFQLIIGPQSPKKLSWDEQRKWARSVEVDGHRDFQLLTRRSGPLAFATVPELFEKECYWLEEHCAGDASCAWYQYFFGGDQDNYLKGYELLGRAGRMIFI